MNPNRKHKWASVVLISGCALLAGAWGYNQAKTSPAAVLVDANTAPSYPPGIEPVQIPYPPRQNDLADVKSADSPDPAREPLSQIWEFNAQQAPEMLPQPLTEPNWYISGVVQQGDNTRVMVQFQGESKVRFYKVGDVLPGGSQLAWVKPGAIGVITPKRKKLQVPILDGVQTANPGASASSGKSTR